ncbi:MAG: hypothetical protein AAF629_24375 [Chloroflexota bacterium]
MTDNLTENETEIEPQDEAPKPTIADNFTWYFSLVLIVLVVCSPCMVCSLFYLNSVPDITWQRGSRDLTMDRIWMAQSQGPIGIGYQWQRVDAEISDTEVCVSNAVRYFLWRRPKLTDIESVETKTVFALQNGRWQSASKPCE